jgi:hypothetical protein
LLASRRKAAAPVTWPVTRQTVELRRSSDWYREVGLRESIPGTPLRMGADLDLQNSSFADRKVIPMSRFSLNGLSEGKKPALPVIPHVDRQARCGKRRWLVDGKGEMWKTPKRKSPSRHQAQPSFQGCALPTPTFDLRHTLCTPLERNSGKSTMFG